MSEKSISLELSLKNYQYDAEVEEFIALHPILKPVLHEAYEQVSKYFGNEFHVILKLVHDPEISNFEHLVGYVWSNRKLTEARATLKDLDYGWYLSLPFEVRSKLYFTVRSKK